jgi:hypothetical protein
MVLWRCHIPQCELQCDSEDHLLAHLHQHHQLLVDPEVKRYPHVLHFRCCYFMSLCGGGPLLFWSLCRWGSEIIFPRFDCQHDFDTWFTIHKAATHTSFAKDQGYDSAGGYYTTWRCTRSARRGEVAADPVIRSLRGKPTIKLEAACTCTVRTCKHVDGSVRAEITGLHTHWRSATELRNSRLSPDTNSFVASMLAIGLGDKAIMRLVQADVFKWERRDDCDTAVSRDSLLSTQDIRNIRRLNSPQLHSCDTTSFDMMVRVLILEENSPILYYKSPGEPARDGLDEDDWCLVISTAWMQEQLAQNVSLSLSSVFFPLWLSRSCLSLPLAHHPVSTLQLLPSLTHFLFSHRHTVLFRQMVSILQLSPSLTHSLFSHRYTRPVG